MPSDLVIALHGGRTIFEVTTFDDCVFTEFLFDRQQRLLDSAFIFERGGRSFFLPLRLGGVAAEDIFAVRDKAEQVKLFSLFRALPCEGRSSVLCSLRMICRGGQACTCIRMACLQDAAHGQRAPLCVVCTDAPELINLVAFAMKTGQKSSALRNFIFTHPSMSEGLNGLFKAF